MSNLIPYLPTDESGRSPTNLVTNEEQLVLDVDGIAYPVIALENGGFYTPGLQVRDVNFKLLTPQVDYVATHKYADASAYTGIEICGAIILLNKTVKDMVYVTAQMVGGDLAFNLNAREDTIGYLRGLGNTAPIWSGFLGEEPLWQDGELRRDRWSLKSLETFILEIENIGRSLREGDPLAENQTREYFLGEYNEFMNNWSTGLDAHLQDKNNPHVDTKHDVDLGQVQNLPVATKPIAQAGLSNGHYLTPALFADEIEAIAVPKLVAHVNDKNNPHKTTAKTARAYTTAEFNQLFAQRLLATAIAENSQALENLSYVQVYDQSRAGLDAKQFLSGMFAADQLGLNVTSDEAVLLGNGRWVAIKDLFARYQTTGGGQFIFMGAYSDYNAVLNNVKSLYADVSRYPVGTFVFWRYHYDVWFGMGNGGAVQQVRPILAIVRTNSDWIHLN